MPDFLRRVIGLAGVAGDAGADDVFPGRRAAAVARDDVVEVQVLAVKSLAAVLAGVVVALENVVPGEFDFLLGQPVEDRQQNDPRHANPEGNGVDAFRVGFLLGKILPLVEIEGLKRAVLRAEDDLRVAFKEQRQGAAGGADIDRLPEAVEHQHMLVQKRTHNQRPGKG